MSRFQRTQDEAGWVWCNHHNKRRYFTRKTAKRWQRLAAKNALWRMSEVDVYRCTEAEGFHLGHPTAYDLARKLGAA